VIIYAIRVMERSYCTWGGPLVAASQFSFLYL
jgi:hypothetical protein